MTLEEFVQLSPEQIRKSERLMQLFVDFYEAAFSFKPKCAGCAFKKGFKKLRKYSTNGSQKISKFETMEKTKTFQLKKKYLTKILTFKKGGITYRKYGNRIDEQFAKDLVAHGQTDLFDKLPNTGKVKVELTLKDGSKELYGSEEGLTVTKYYESMDDSNRIDYHSKSFRRELMPIYKELSEALGKEAKSRRKEDIIAFLQENEG